MTRIRRLVLDVLKAHKPSVLELGRALAGQDGLKVKLTVLEIDEKTETLQIEITGEDIDFDRIRDAIDEFGASLHSIDEVEVDAGSGSGG
ncbi:MAG: DUF211 domain-containing protein [Gammaproteobacteria bacterium]|nr:DUF211 domain-containing protein [Gammaproteobacteria bacterium]